MSSREESSPLVSSLHQALRAWHKIQGTPDDLLHDLLCVRARRKKLANEGKTNYQRLAANQILLDGITELEGKDELGAKILRERFLNREITTQVAYMVNLSADQVNRRQHDALELLAEILLAQDETYRAEQIETLLAQLPQPTYTRLFGNQTARTTLLDTLQTGSPWVIAITGLGGLGKTALADAVARDAARTFVFEQLIWLRAEIHTLTGASASPSFAFNDLMAQLGAKLTPPGSPPITALAQIRYLLKETPTLVIIDNLEHEADALTLFPQLQELSDPSKFLLTSRLRPPAQAHVFIYPLDELPLSDAEALLRHHAQEIGLLDLANAPTEVLNPVFEKVGGNPLAIQLITRLTAVLPLPHILADLPHARTASLWEMYKHIYWKTWHTLSEEGRKLLQLMPLIAETGAELEHLQEISLLPPPALLAAIEELTARSLLELRGTPWNRRYGIHRLTDTFLRSEIIDWPETPS